MVITYHRGDGVAALTGLRGAVGLRALAPFRFLETGIPSQRVAGAEPAWYARGLKPGLARIREVGGPRLGRIGNLAW